MCADRTRLTLSCVYIRLVVNYIIIYNVACLLLITLCRIDSVARECTFSRVLLLGKYWMGAFAAMMHMVLN